MPVPASVLPEPTFVKTYSGLKGWLKGLKGLKSKPFSQFLSEYQ